jgi:hypothetical protein
VGSVGAHEGNVPRVFGVELHALGCAVPSARARPDRIAGFQTWLKLGRRVRKGEAALRILAPITVKQREQPGSEDIEERRVFFKTAFVFDVSRGRRPDPPGRSGPSQTDVEDGADPVPWDAPREPLTGNSHARLIGPMTRSAGSLGYSVSLKPIAGSAGGWCDRAPSELLSTAACRAMRS